MSTLRDFASRLTRNILWPCLSLLPAVPRKVLCQSFNGRGYSDSPKAIAGELLRQGWTVYWAVKSPKDRESLPAGIRPVILNSPAYLYHMCTSAVWVDNCRKWGHIRKKPSQLYLQTWHGFPLKRIEGDAEEALGQDYVSAAKKDSALCDLLISNSRFLTEIYRRAFWYGGEVLECGFPRNDCLFASGEEAAAKVRRELDLPQEKKLLLYAPTFRKDQGLSAYDLDYQKLTEALSRRFGGEWLVLAKLHPNIATKAEELRLDPQYVVNASSYPDIQELYLVCSALVTDYSSVMFDYMCTGKPCFLYVNDLESYRGDRNFYFDLDLLPFPRAETNAQLARAIEEFNEASQHRRTEEFREKFGILEDGHAARRVAQWLAEHSR